jgi:flagellar assembly factor FliW
MKVRTTRFGEIEVEENRVFDFQRGLVGFPELRRFCMMEHKEPVRWLQSLDDPDVAFIVLDSFGLIPEYSFELDVSVEQQLDIEDINTVVTFFMLSVRQDGVTANLRTPVLINMENMKGAQLTIEDSRVPARFSLEPSMLFMESAA